jgi:hypothetical protein
MGGYTAVVAEAVDRTMTNLKENPRLQDELAAYRTALRLKLPEMREKVQAIVSRTGVQQLFPKAIDPERARATGQGLPRGSYPELELRAPNIKWAGRADLLTLGPDYCEIIDYKTGSPEDEHKEQIRIYSLLWARDQELNPGAGGATRLILRYSAADVMVQPPDAVGLRALETLLADRTKAARQAASERPPNARPDAEICDGCPVRQMCPEYWNFLDGRQVLTFSPSTPGVAFSDVEVRIEGRNGPRSWMVQVTCGKALKQSKRAILRAPSESVTFPIGRSIRILNVAVGGEDQTDLVTLTITSNSEVFLVDSQN